MSNTIRRPRKRPRVKSCSFRTLGWLIRREAAFHIITPHPPVWAIDGQRAIWMAVDWPHIERIARKILAHVPERRYYP